jgi:drug/metabolite transporter (DMT)-like permease
MSASAGGPSVSGLQQLVAVLGLMVFGALNTVTSKVQFTMESFGTQSPNPKLFEKPIWITFSMFCAMSLVIFAHYFQQWRLPAPTMTAEDGESGNEPLLHSENSALSEVDAFKLIGIPAAFDLTATALMMGGLLFMNASVYQMLRGSIIVFAFIIYKFVFKRESENVAFKYFGVFVCVGGVCFVGASSILNTSSGDAPGKKISSAESAFGILLVVLAQVCQAAQVVAEEKFMKEVKLPALMIVGYEGIWGVILCVLIVFPVAWAIPGKDGGHLEDVRDTLAMMSNNRSLVALFCLYLFSCSTFNIASVSVTKFFNTVHRTMFEASRTSVIWAFGLVVHKFIDKMAAYGEAWLPYSYLEAMGFVLLLFGQAVYGEVILLPCFEYPAQKLPELKTPQSPH